MQKINYLLILKTIFLMKNNLKNTKSNNTTVAISTEDNLNLTNFCNRYEIQKKEFIKTAVSYFEKNGINPKIHAEPKSEIEKILKRIDQFFGFIKILEKEYLKPAVSSITSTQILLQKSIENLATKNHVLGIPTTRHLEALRNDIDKELQKQSKEQKEILLKISNNVIASHQKLIQELEIIKNKKGISF